MASSMELAGGQEAETARLVEDPEAGEVSAADSDEEVTSYYDSDEDEEDGTAKKKKKPPPMGKWKKELAALTREPIPEDKLHVVAWGRVIKHTVLNMLTVMLFVAFALVAHVPVLVSLPLFMVDFVLAVTLWEYLQQCGDIRLQVGSGVLLIVIIVAAFFVPSDFIPLGLQMLIVPLLLITILLGLFEKPWRTTLHSTAIWQAITGRKYGMLLTQLDLAKLMKSIYHYKGGGLKFMRRFWDCANKAGWYDYSTIKIRLVEVDETSADVADVALDLNGEDIEPEKFLLTGLTRRQEDGTTDDLSMEDFEGIVKQRKFISNKLLDSWLKPLAAEGEGEGAAESAKKPLTRVEKVRRWTGAAKFPPAGADQMVVRFRRADYLKGLYEHWAPRAMRALLLTAVLSWPAVHILMAMDKHRRHLCDIGGPNEGSISGSKSLSGTDVCGVEDLPSCDEICVSLLTFLSAVHASLGTSQVEIGLVFAIIPVFIFNYSVAMAQQEHNRKELIYLRRLKIPKKAVTEVMRMKNTLEDVFQIEFLFDRFVTSLRAWMGADPALAACGAITEAEFDLTATRGVNDCFKQVMEPVSVMKSSISCDISEPLLYGVGYGANACESPEVTKDNVNDQWALLKFKNGLGNDSGRNYKVMLDLVMYTADSWKDFKAWCKNEYKAQFDYVTQAEQMNGEVQDNGKLSHLTQNTPIFDILLPKGFSLTHFFITNMPEDGMPLQIELQGMKTGAKGIWDQCDNLEHNLTKAVVDDEEEEEEEEEKDVDVLTKRLDRFPIRARFALSEQYYNAMSTSDIQQLCGEGPAPKDFTEFVDRMLTPSEFEIHDEPEGKNYLFFTGISVFMGDESPLRAMLAAMRALLYAMRVWIECLGLAMAVPLVRVFIVHKSLYPEPFSLLLVFNTLTTWFLLVSFFGDFYSARTRLNLVSQCLSILETKTISGNSQFLKNMPKKPPSAEEGKDAGGEEKPEGEGEGEGGGEADAQEAKKSQEDSQEARPFDLVIEDSVSAGVQYNPTDKNWVDCWRLATKNLSNWHFTVAHLRVYVSTSRLVAQTMLVAAAFVVGFLLLLSLLQAANGEGVPSLAKAAKHSVVGKLARSAAASAAGSRRLQEEVGDAMETLLQERFSAQHLAAGTAAAAAEPLSKAARRLREALAPAHVALHGALLQQHDTLVDAHAWLQEASLAPAAGVRAARRRLEATGAGAAMMAKVKSLQKSLDVTKATKTQIYSVLMIVFVMMYSVPLMWNIVQVNGYFDRHEDLMVKTKERHRLYQAKRETQRRKRLEEEKVKGDGASEAPAEDQAEKEKAVTKPEEAKNTCKDPECRNYEKVLDMAIETSKKSRERFPLKLFGFVITAQLLGTWVFLAASPLVSQAKQMAPGLAVGACSYIETSKMVKTLQKQMDLSNPSMHFKVRGMIHDNICGPLRGAMAMAMTKLPGLSKAHAQNLAGKLSGRATPAVPAAPAAPAKPAVAGKRRLLAKAAAEEEEDETAPLVLWGSRANEIQEVPMPDLQAIVRSWWHAHPAQHPEAKYATAHAALQELERSGRRLLSAAPAAVVRAWQDHEGSDDLQPAFAAAMAAAKPHLELAAEEALEDSSGERATTIEHGEL